MAQSYRSRFLAVQRQNEQALRSLFAQLANSIAAEVRRRADNDGNVPRSVTFDIQQAAGELVRRLFLGRNRNGELAPFDTLPNGAVIPLSPYMRQLWTAISAAVRIPVEQNAAVLTNRLPADILIVMRNATRNPFAATKQAVREQVFRPNPLAAYDAPHAWVDPNGYRLSDRIWNCATATRRHLDLYLDTAIRAGRGALTMSRELEQFLIPGRTMPTTNAPYGATASFDAMRLARTEITRAHGHAAEVSAAMNPFVQGMQWNLSASHPRFDICDGYARGGPNGDGVYLLGELPSYPAHPQCVTPGQMVTTDRGDLPIEQVQVGDRVLTHKGRYRPVLAAWATPHEGKVYRFETEQGSFELTGNHPVLLRSGWVNAEFVKPGDKVLHTGVGTGFDFLVGEVDEMPAFALNPGMAHLKKSLFFAPVPVFAVAFNTDPDRRDRNVDKVTPDLYLSFVKDSSGVKRRVHGDFQGARVSEPDLPVAQEHGHEAGVASSLGIRDFAGDIGALGGIVVTSQIPCEVGCAHSFGKCLASTSVVFLPTGGNGVAFASHGDIVGGQQVTEYPVGNAILGEDLGAGEPFFDIDFSQQVSDRAAILFFEPQSVKGSGRDFVDFLVPFEVFQGRVTDGTSNHNSLLSLSPDKRWGAESGNSGVRGVITPSLALLYYSTILSVSTYQYTGKVYNMEVADDHSYTVNGAVVHNCLCYLTNVMVSNPSAMIDELRADVQAARQAFVTLVGPLLVEQFISLLLGQGLEVEYGIPGLVGVFR